MVNWLELQSRALDIIHILNSEASRESAKEVDELKRKLADSSSLKSSLDTNASLNDQVKKLTTDIIADMEDVVL